MACRRSGLPGKSREDGNILLMLAADRPFGRSVCNSLQHVEAGLWNSEQEFGQTPRLLLVETGPPVGNWFGLPLEFGLELWLLVIWGGEPSEGNSLVELVVLVALVDRASSAVPIVFGSSKPGGSQGYCTNCSVEMLLGVL